jgi:hypothetical protein
MGLALFAGRPKHRAERNFMQRIEQLAAPAERE